jgi:transaldolase
LAVLLTIAPNLIDELAAMDIDVPRQLSPSMSMDMQAMSQVSLTHEEFSAAYQQDTVTQDLLPKGIDGFIGARDELAKTLAALRG